jgi:sorting nexin-1/2
LEFAELAAAAGEFSQTVSDLSASDVGKQISRSLASLAEVERQVQELQSAQAQQDLVTLMSTGTFRWQCTSVKPFRNVCDTADEYARLINSVRVHLLLVLSDEVFHDLSQLAFHGRIRTYHTWQNAENNLKRIKQAHEASRSQGRQILSHSLNQIAEVSSFGFSAISSPWLRRILQAERRALEQKHEFEHVSKLVKSEVARFERERIEDSKDALQTFLEGMISRQKTVSLLDWTISWTNLNRRLLVNCRLGETPATVAQERELREPAISNTKPRVRATLKRIH